MLYMGLLFVRLFAVWAGKIVRRLMQSEGVIQRISSDIGWKLIIFTYLC